MPPHAQEARHASAEDQTDCPIFGPSIRTTGAPLVFVILGIKTQVCLAGQHRGPRTKGPAVIDAGGAGAVQLETVARGLIPERLYPLSMFLRGTALAVGKMQEE
jgi:hypothetical protein